MFKGNKPRIGLDLLGSDADSSSLLEFALPVLQKNQDLAEFVLFGEQKNEQTFRSHPEFSYHVAQEAIHMEDDPLWAIRKKTNSSLILGLLALKAQEIDAFISLGNTGALTAGACLHLGLLPQISRPALLALVPPKSTALLDIGANTTVQPSQFLEFAALGLAYQKTRGIKRPTLGLLNIGREPIKGPPDLRQVYLELDKLNQKAPYPFFLGNLESKDLFQGLADIVLTDGFTGNIFLKTAEAMADFLHAPEKISSLEHSGAILLGTQGLVLKCHGKANPQVFAHSIHHALSLLPEKKAFASALAKEVDFLRSVSS